MKDVEAQTSGHIKMGPGTLYGSLKRMQTAGLIEESGDRPDPKMGRRTQALLSPDRNGPERDQV